MTTLTFVIHGETITQTAREAVVEGRFDRGYEILMDSLVGMTADYAMKILSGEYRLVGSNNDVFMEEDPDSADYKAQLEDMYGGCVRIEGRVMRPYAVVTMWGPEDFNRQVTPTRGSDFVEARYASGIEEGINLAGRSLFYADDPARDVLKTTSVKYLPPSGRLSEEHHILFKDVSGFPDMMVKTVKTIEEAVIFHKDRLREVGYDCEFPKEVYAGREDQTTPHYEPRRVVTTFDAAERTPYKTEPRIKSDDELREQRIRDEQRAEKLKQDLAEWKQQIIEQANGDFMELTWEDDAGNIQSVMIPSAPFENWALWRTDGAMLAKPWTTVCPSGLKMVMDDPYHTDWMVGAGLPLDWMSDDKQAAAAYDLQYTIQDEKLDFKIPVLCGEGIATGEIVHLNKGDRLPAGKIGIIKNAGPDYVEAAYDAINNGGALITEAGGSMAHLVTVGRGAGLRLVRIPDARKKLVVGITVDINCSNGSVLVHKGRRKMIIA